MTTTPKAKPTKKVPATKTPTKKLAAKKPTGIAALAARYADNPAAPFSGPGASALGGTDTQVQALGVTTQEKALALGKQYLPAGRGEGLSDAEAYALDKRDVATPVMEDVPLPQSEALPAVVFTGEAPALAPADDAPKTPVQDAFGSAADQKATPPPAKRQAAVGMHFAQRVTRLKMTLHSVAPLVNPALTRCTFGAVYSATPGEEDKVYGDATPYGELSYNVRSDLAAALEVGAAYYIDIQKVPS